MRPDDPINDPIASAPRPLTVRNPKTGQLTTDPSECESGPGTQHPMPDTRVPDPRPEPIKGPDLKK